MDTAKEGKSNAKPVSGKQPPAKPAAAAKKDTGKPPASSQSNRSGGRPRTGTSAAEMEN